MPYGRRYGGRRGRRTGSYFPMYRRPVQPAGFTASPEGIFSKFTTNFDWGLKLNTVPVYDEPFQVNGFALGPGADNDYLRLADTATVGINSTAIGTSNAMYYANQTNGVPTAWTSRIIPYRNFIFLGVKVKLTIFPRMSFALDGNITETQRIVFGIGMDKTMGTSDWYDGTLNFNGMSTTYRNRWSAMAQKRWKELPSPLNPRNTVIEKYFSFTKHEGLTPAQYMSTAAPNLSLGTPGPYHGSITYYDTGAASTGTVTNVFNPTSGMYLHVMASQCGDWEDGTVTETILDNFVGRMKLTYYVKLYNANAKLSMQGNR